jgi:hypothetical protein
MERAGNRNQPARRLWQRRSIVPLDVLATYLAGAQIALAWWLKSATPTAETVAQAFHATARGNL